MKNLLLKDFTKVLKNILKNNCFAIFEFCVLILSINGTLYPVETIKEGRKGSQLLAVIKRI